MRRLHLLDGLLWKPLNEYDFKHIVYPLSYFGPEVLKANRLKVLPPIRPVEDYLTPGITCVLERYIGEDPYLDKRQWPQMGCTEDELYEMDPMLKIARERLAREEMVYPRGDDGDRPGYKRWRERVAARKKRTVLVVEDDPIMLEIEKEMLHGDELTWIGEVYGEQDGRAGLETYHRVNPDIIVSGLGMPVMNGEEFLKTIREQDEFTPFVLITGWPYSTEIVQSLLPLLNGFMGKPFQQDDFISLIKKVGTHSPAILRVNRIKPPPPQSKQE